MEEREQEVKIVQIVACCPEQGCEGIMNPTSRPSKLSYPPTYEHRCTNCSYTTDSQHIYPRYEYRKIEQKI